MRCEKYTRTGIKPGPLYNNLPETFRQIGHLFHYYSFSDSSRNKIFLEISGYLRICLYHKLSRIYRTFSSARCEKNISNIVPFII